METQTYFCNRCSSEFAVLVYNIAPAQPETEAYYRKHGPRSCPMCGAPGAYIEPLNTRDIDAPGVLIT